MKKIVFLLLLAVTCKVTFAQSGDTLNITDAAGKKQGRWIILNKTAQKPDFKDEQKVEEGKFVDSKKMGVWIEYFPNNMIKSKITYENNRPNGYAMMYNDNGKIKEEGLWQNSRWVGDYKLYYDNGEVQQEFKFNASGKREGPQKYYFDNGQVMIEGNWQGGKEAGTLKEYYENGDLKEERTFNDGSLDPATVKSYQPKAAVVKAPEPKVETPPVIPQKTEKDNLGKPFSGEGYWKLFNSNRQVSTDGIFSNYKLVDGKKYFYNNDGILMRIAVYKGGRYVGDAIIEQQ